MTGRVVVVTGTGTDAGKTVVTAALAASCAASGRRVAAVKPDQTGVGPGEPGDLDVVRATGLVVGAWPAGPGLAERCNLDDLQRIGVLVLGMVPEGAGRLHPQVFRSAASSWLPAPA